MPAIIRVPRGKCGPIFFRRPGISRKTLVQIAEEDRKSAVYETLHTVLSNLGFQLLPAEELKRRQRDKALIRVQIGKYGYFVYPAAGVAPAEQTG